MASVDLDRHQTWRDRRRSERREYLAIFCLVYPPFLLAALVARAAAALAGRGGARPRRSIFAEARSAAASAIPFAFR